MARSLVLTGLLIFLSGCTALPEGDRWGAEATLTPGWDRVGRAAWRALSEPATWLPAAGAVVFAFDHLDSRVSEWAVRETPVFGSPSRAADAGDLLYGAGAAAFVASLVATPSGEDPGGWLSAKARGFAVEGSALLATEGTVAALKTTTDRTRPNEQRQGSFPSGHATNAFALATLTARNLDAIAIDSGALFALQAGAYTLASATAWSRLEAQKHYPSDLLAGAAIGHFLSAFIHDAFLGLPGDDGMEITFSPAPGGGTIALGWAF